MIFRSLNSFSRTAYTTVDRIGRKAGDIVIQWVILTDDVALAEGLGEFLARTVPGQWKEEQAGGQRQCVLESDGDERGERAWPLARSLARYLISYHGRAWLESLLSCRYKVFDTVERRQIVDYAIRLLHTDLDQDLERLDLATTIIFNYLATQPLLVAEGLRTFLLKDIRDEFVEALDHAVDAHLMEREYQEFVQLLRRMVNLAGSRQDWIHVHFSRNRFFFEDAAGVRLGDELVHEMLSDLDVDSEGLEEVLISALVTLAPIRITIHQGPLAAEGRETLLRVFDGRILFCRGCGRCYHAHIDSGGRSF